MNAKDLLNMDMETASQWLLQFWRWWTGELMGMLPAQWRERFSRRSRATAEFRGDDLVYRNGESGEAYAVRPRGAIAFLMPSECVLVREVELPLLPMADVKRMIALDVDRLTPFQPEQVYFDAEIVERDQDSGRQQVAVGFLPRDTAERVLEEVHKRDLSPAVLGVKAHSFDFLAAIRDSQGGSAAHRRSLYWWAAAAALLVFNLFLLTWRDSANLDQLRQTVDAQQTPVTVAMRTRARVDGEQARRAALLQARAQGAPMPVLDAVTSAMPMDAWVRRFEWNGRSVHIVGARKSSQDILAKLEATPELRNARSLATENHTDTAGNTAFEYSADRDPGAVK